MILFEYFGVSLIDTHPIFITLMHLMLISVYVNTFSNGRIILSQTLYPLIHCLFIINTLYLFITSSVYKPTSINITYALYSHSLTGKLITSRHPRSLPTHKIAPIIQTVNHSFVGFSSSYEISTVSNLKSH